MKKKFLILTGLLFAWMGTQPVVAQTDVTSQYIQNADFETTPITFPADGNGTAQTDRIGSTGWVFTVPGWTNASVIKNNAVQIATAGYGLSTAVGNGLNSTTPPSTDNAGSAGNCLHMSAGWGDDAVLTQAVSLPAGKYSLTYYVYNQNTSTGIAENFTGIKFADGTTQYGTLKTAPQGQWVSETIYFDVTVAQTVTLSLGFTTATGGSASGSKLYVDNLTLQQWGLKGSAAEPEDFSVWVGSSVASWTGAGGTYGSAGYVERYTYGTPSGEYLSQTLTNLPLGVYDLVLYCSSSSTSERDVAVTAVTDGDTRYVTLSANNVAQAIPSYNRTTVDTPNEEEKDTLSDIKVTDGTLKMAVTINETGPNWIIVKGALLQYKGADLSLLKDALNDAIAIAEAIDQNALNEYAKTRLSEAITAAKTVAEEETALKTATDNLQEAIIVANDIATVYPKFLTYKEVLEKSIATADDKDTYETALKTAETIVEGTVLSAEITTALASLETARQAYVKVAQPADGYSFDMTFTVTNAAVSSATGWTNGKVNTGEQYTGAPDNTYLDLWNATADMYQTVSGLPEGKYSLTAATRANTGLTSSYIYAQGSGDKQTAVTENVGSTDNTLGNGWGWTTLESIDVASSLTIGFYAGCPNGAWAGADDFHLTYQGLDAAAALALYEATVATANAYLSRPMEASIKNAINGKNNLTSSNTRDELLQAHFDLLPIIASAEISVINYAYLQHKVNTAKSLGIEVTEQETAMNNGSYSNEEAVEQLPALNVAIYKKVQSDYTQEYAVPNSWTGSGFTAKTEQHWSGEARTYYDNWGANLNNTYTNELTLPAGEYVLMASARSGVGANLQLTVGETTVRIYPKGGTGYGIDVNGAATFGTTADYANGDAGYGWEWEYVHFNLDAETKVSLKANLTTGSSADWGSFSDVTVKMSTASYINMRFKELQELIAASKPWTEEGEYVTTTYPSYQGKQEADYTSGDAIDTDIANLKSAFEAYALENASIEHPFDVTNIIGNADCTLNDPYWVGSGRLNRDNGAEHWSGRVQTYFAANTAGYVRKQTVTLPYIGAYLLKTSVRALTSAAYAQIKFGDEEVRTGYTGNTGGTIATDGTEWESIEAGIAAGKSFANDDKGYGWVYNKTFHGALTEGEEVEIGISLSVVNNSYVGDEGNCGGMKLYYIGKHYENTVDGVAKYYGIYENGSSIELTDEAPAVDLAQAAISGATVVATNPNGLIYAKESAQVNVTDNVILDGVCANLKLADGHSFVAPTAFTATTATYKMESIASDGTNSFGTLCLPFEAALPEGSKAYTLDQGVTMGDELRATESVSVPANKPVLVTTAGDYSASNTEIAATAAGATNEWGELVGVYAATTAPQGSFVLQKHDEKVAFYIVGSEVQPTVKPFRAYIKPQDSEASALRVVFDFDGETTAVDAINAAIGVTEVARYDAAGVPISRPQKGINIVRMSDGSVRKVLIK